jgi:hypothetical protein
MQKMKIDDLISTLSQLRVETGSLACLGCGHEHNCSTSGCAIIREAIEVLRDASWISVADRLPDDDVMVLCVVSGRPQTNITLDEAMEIASHSRTEGWIVETWPEWEDPTVTYWMPLPEPPKED